MRPWEGREHETGDSQLARRVCMLSATQIGGLEDKAERCCRSVGEDEQLMLQAAGGDMDAFEELVLRQQQGALSVAYRFLGDRTRAEDVVQDAFLKILANASTYEPRARFGTYLYGVVWRLCIDRYRRRRPQRLESSLDPVASSAEPEEAMRRAEAAQQVRDAIAELPSRQRMALVLKHYQELSYEEIGQAMSCSPQAVDALLSRARRKLKEKLRNAL